MMSISRDRDTNSTSEEAGATLVTAPCDDLRPVIMPSMDDGTILRAAFKCISAVGSIALHVGAAAAMLVWFEPKPGMISMTTEAITVELVASDVIEAMMLEPPTAISAAAGAPDVRAGSEHEAPTRQQSDKVEPTTTEPAKHVAEAVDRHLPRESEPPRELTETRAQDAEPTDTPQAAGEVPVQTARLDEALIEAIASAEEASAKSADVQREQPEPEAAAAANPKDAAPANIAPKPQASRQKTEASTPSRKGGAPSRGEKTSQRSPARASASAGEAINYAAIVRARVASRRPMGPGHRGTVQITFGVSPSGALSFASISRSSGDSGLDQSVLAAVRSAAPFPPPPAGRQRQFSMPFYFQ